MVLHDLHGSLHEERGVHFGKARAVGAMSATTVTEQQQVVGVVGARGALGLVEVVVFQVGSKILLDALGYIGGFQSPPTIIRSLVLQMLLVHFPLYILTVSADFGCHADRQLVRLQKVGDFGDKGGKFQTGTDVVLVLAEKYRQRLYGVASALYQLLIGGSFLYGCHVLALQVLGNRHFLGCLVRQLGDDSRDFPAACDDGRTVSALPENNLVTVCSGNGAHGDRL